ncbi:hypothetical protein EDB84DRAFT_1658953 [Lactarius hengduanensis]|nr:hypothetical protein EDB84DRAFT_1658953 [Lactarius hengduanensis]
MTFVVRLVVIIPALTNLNTGSLVNILKSIITASVCNSSLTGPHPRASSQEGIAASSVDLTSTSLLPREETEVPSSSNRLTERHEGFHGSDDSANAGKLSTREDASQSSDAPSISSLFSELGRRSHSAENQFEARAGQDIALPVPGAMSTLRRGRQGY